MAISYYGDPISENIADTPEGYRICRNAVLCRTGFQTYMVSELSETIREKLRGFGVDVDHIEEIEFYRPEEEVFSPTFIASFEGKPLTDEHPEELLDSETHQEHCVGHVQNVRKGKEPLRSGDMPLLGDVFITDKAAVEQHKNGRRELSCGYTYDIRQDGNRIIQCDYLANHEALVPKGRAGKEVGIMDAAPPEVTREPFDMSIDLKKIRKMGWLAWARDAKPEEVADAAAALEEANEKKGSETETSNNEGKGSTGKGADADEHPEKCKCSDCMPTGKDAMALKAAKDAAAEKEKEKGKADDDEDGEVTEAEAKAALATLREALEQDEDKSGEADDADDDDEDDDDEAMDSDIVAAVEPLDASERPKEIIATDSGVAVLKVLRPMVARSKDKQLRAAFDTAAKLVNSRVAKAGKSKNGGYDGFTKASQKSGQAAMDSHSKPGDGATDCSKLEDAYAKFRGKPIIK